VTRQEDGRVPSAPGSRPSDGAASASPPVGFDPSRFSWRPQAARFAQGKDLRVGGITIGSAFYDGVSSRALTDRYRIETKLPGLRPTKDRFATEQEARAALERFTLAWLRRLLGCDSGSRSPSEDPRSGAEAVGRQSGGSEASASPNLDSSHD
jgi:hypothetical protein